LRKSVLGDLEVLSANHKIRFVQTVARGTLCNWEEPEASAVCWDKVTASGKVYQRGGSKAIVIEKIEAQASQASQK
jgi:hypothetical protein